MAMLRRRKPDFLIARLFECISQEERLVYKS